MPQPRPLLLRGNQGTGAPWRGSREGNVWKKELGPTGPAPHGLRFLSFFVLPCREPLLQTMAASWPGRPPANTAAAFPTRPRLAHSQQEGREQQHGAVERPAPAPRPPALLLVHAAPAEPAAAAAAEAASHQRHQDDEEEPDGRAHPEAQLVVQQLGEEGGEAARSRHPLPSPAPRPDPAGRDGSRQPPAHLLHVLLGPLLALGLRQICDQLWETRSREGCELPLGLGALRVGPCTLERGSQHRASPPAPCTLLPSSCPPPAIVLHSPFGIASPQTLRFREVSPVAVSGRML